MQYFFRSCVGTFSIGPDEVHLNMFQLCFGGLWLCTTETAEEAAQRVSDQKTGMHEWDILADADAPDDLSEWETS